LLGHFVTYDIVLEILTSFVIHIQIRQFHIKLVMSKVQAVLVVDPISTGRVLAEKLMERGYNVVTLWTAQSQRVEGIGECNLQFLCEVHEVEFDFDATLAAIKALPYDFIASIVGCECGVEINDFLSEKLGLASNGTVFAEARRDKWAMQERIRECGLRAIKQTVVSTIEEVQQFVTRENMRKWVMKPRRDAGSHGVFLCETIEESQCALDKICSQVTIFGEKNESVLLQEFLDGKEYVVDTVSCNGEHRAVAIWEYDRVYMHGSAFVYLDDHLYESADGKKEEALVDYIFQVITALGVEYGPCHAEVMWLQSEDRPCLVEVGTRPHGAGGNFPKLCDPVIGYNQLDVNINAYFAPEKFSVIPKRPLQLNGMGIQYKMICYEDGILEGYDMTEIEKLESFIGIDWHRSVGEAVIKTIDLVSAPAIIRLCHSDASVVAREKLLLRAFEKDVLKIKQTEAVLVVDPISTGRVLAEKLMERGYNVVCLWTAQSQRVEGIGECHLKFLCEVHEVEFDYEATFQKVSALPYKFIASLVGCECGVEINDFLSEKLQIASNGTVFAEARRDKWAMQETIRESGLRAIKQTVVSTIEEVEQFVKQENMRKWVMKPRRDAGSHGVFLCETLEEARTALSKICSQVTIFGEKNDAVLLQEFLDGKEYVVDTVSCNGEHRAVAIWEYDRVFMHGSAFVYLDDHLYESEDGKKEEALVDYIFQVITALGVQYGPCHAEVMWLQSEDRPCLVEVGTRPHGAGGNFPKLCDPVIGYNQLDVNIDAYFAPEKFSSIPKRPVQLLGMGIQYKMICYEDGILEGYDMSEIEKLDSFIGIDWHKSIGEKVIKTIDLVSAPAIIRLCHPDASVVAREKLQLRAFEKNVLKIKPHQMEAVLVVDPISTGRVLAEKLMERGYNVVCLWTAQSQRVEGIGECNLKFLCEVHEVEFDFEATYAAIAQLPYKFIASIVGCECGVEINDFLSEKLGLASNGTVFAEARRDKWAMQERIRECGLRAIKQTVVSTIEEVEQFVCEENLSKWVMKPRRDAGSHGVFLCETMEESRIALSKICSQVTIFGEKNDSVLLQEFLDGKEYVIDTVSCNGDHRAVAIWEYDRVFMHGSAFVYLDDHLYESQDGNKEEVMVDYIFQVITALGVQFGPCHAEVMWLQSEDRPCLVEVGTRPHGAGGNFPKLCDPVIGYNQLDVNIDAYFSPEKFFVIPKRPLQLHGMGIQYKMICYEDGILEGYDMTEIEKLESFIGIDWHRSVGEKVIKTIDLVSAPAIIRLCHPDAAVVAREKHHLRTLEKQALKIKKQEVAQLSPKAKDMVAAVNPEDIVLSC